VLRAVKNRFGSTNEIGVMEMTATGLKDVANPSGLFLRERPAGESGSVVVAALEGTRPILVEIQALVGSSFLAMPRRTTSGVDFNRASIIIVALEKKMALKLSNQDIFINVAGGLQIIEPAADLGIALAIASAHKNKPVDNSLVVVGEVGLAGEIRAVSHIEKRIQEAFKLGYKKFLLPATNQVKKDPGLIPAKSLSEAINLALG
jgi:DNA repair protein RadA/Sms